jgi:hypothetical protein
MLIRYPAAVCYALAARKISARAIGIAFGQAGEFKYKISVAILHGYESFAGRARITQHSHIGTGKPQVSVGIYCGQFGSVTGCFVHAERIKDPDAELFSLATGTGIQRNAFVICPQMSVLYFAAFFFGYCVRAGYCEYRN